MEPAACPWDGFAPETGDMFCEESLCAWVETPANAHSSWAYVLVGLAVLWSGRRRGEDRLDTRALGFIAIWLGFGSFFLHASMTFAGQVADLLGMFLCASWVFATNAARAGLVRPGRAQTMLFAALVLASVGAMLVMGFGTPAVVVVAVLALLLEVRLHRRRGPPVGGYRAQGVALGALSVSFVFWGLDVAKVGCDPDNHLLQGHALWHLTNAPVFWWLHRFYRGLDALGSTA